MVCHILLLLCYLQAQIAELQKQEKALQVRLERAAGVSQHVSCATYEQASLSRHERAVGCIRADNEKLRFDQFCLPMYSLRAALLEGAVSRTL